MKPNEANCKEQKVFTLHKIQELWQMNSHILSYRIASYRFARRVIVYYFREN